MKNFSDLTEREILAVAISSEEEDSRIYMSFAEDLAERYPASAKVFEEMAEEEKSHRNALMQMYEERFGPHLPPIRREDVKGFLKRRPVWLSKNLRSRPCARKRRTWNIRPPASIRRRPSVRPILASASCWVIWRQWKRRTGKRLAGWKKPI